MRFPTSLDPMRLSGGPAIECATLAGAPAGIETDADVAAVIEPICDFFRARQDEASAFVIACFSDPGIRCGAKRRGPAVLRDGGKRLPERRSAGEIASGSSPSCPRRWRAITDTSSAWVSAIGSRPICRSGSVSRTSRTSERTFGRLCDAGRALRDDHRADVMLLGCAGMAQYRRRLEKALGYAGGGTGAGGSDAGAGSGPGSLRAVLNAARFAPDAAVAAHPPAVTAVDEGRMRRRFRAISQFPASAEHEWGGVPPAQPGGGGRGPVRSVMRP